MFTAKSSSVVLRHQATGGCGSQKINSTTTQVPACRNSTCLDRQSNRCSFRLQLLISGTQVMLHHRALASRPPNKSRNVIVYSNVESGAAGAPPPNPSSSNWRGWLIGVIMSFLLPLWKNQLWSLKKIEDKVEVVVETMEEVVEAVEELSEKVEEAVDEIGDSLPEGELKEMLENVEKAADKAGKAAKLAHQVLDKVQATEDQVQSLIDGANENKNQQKPAKV